MKDRALLALLILSPGQHRRRLWLQDMLWKSSQMEAGQMSLRRVLSNIRRDLGPLRDCLKSDRNAVWLDPPFLIAEHDDLPPSEFLADLDVPNEEFESWQRDRRQAIREPEGHATGFTPSQRVALVPTVSIVPLNSEPEGSRFLSTMLAQQLAGLIFGFGQCLTVIAARPQNGTANYTFVIEVRPEDAEWQVLIRLLGDPVEIYLWSGRIRARGSIAHIWDSLELTSLLNKALVALGDQLALRGPDGDIARIQRAIRRIFHYDRPGLEAAIGLLRSAANGDNIGLALAWQAFAQLTSILEFRENKSKRAEEAIALSEEALRRSPQNPTVLGLVAQVHLKFNRDFDYSHHLALRGIAVDEDNPYALDALSQSHMLRGELAVGHKTAERARQTATGLANSFSWDMQSAFGALCMGRLSDAQEIVRICHQKMPVYRPALRYLVALNLMLGNEADALLYSARLARLEPGFKPQTLLDAQYPVETLRNLGLANDLKGCIG